MSTPDQSVSVPSEAQLGKQYISSTGPRILSQFGAPFGTAQGAGIHALPLYIDELEMDWGTDIYMRMLWDSAIKAADSQRRDAILAKPLQITPSLSQDDDAPPRKKAYAKNISDFVAKNFECLPNFSSLLREALDCMPMGYKLIEQVYDTRTLIPENGPQTCLAQLAPKPQEAVSIVCDMFNTVVCYLPRRPGSSLVGFFLWGDLGFPSIEGQMSDDATVTVPGAVPPEKIWRLTWCGRNGSPVGTSDLRAAYIPWRLKIGLYPAYEAYLARFAQPSAKIELEGAVLAPVMAASGEIITDPKLIAQKYLNDLANWQAGGGMLLPVGHAELVQASSNGQAYLSAFELCDQQIMQSIVYSQLSTQGGKYGTQALGEVHQDTEGLIVQMGKLFLAESIRQMVVRPLVLYNYGEEGLNYLPNVSFGDVEQQDTTQRGAMYAQLKGAGILFPQQYNAMFKAIGLPVLDEDVIDQLIALWEETMNQQVQMMQQQAAMGAAGQQPGGQPGQPGGGQPGTKPGQGAGGPQNGSQGQPGAASGGGKGQQNPPNPASRYYGQ